MKPLLKIGVLALASLGIGYGVAYRLAVTPELSLEQQQNAETEWLRQEFHLNASQIGAVSQVDARFALLNEQMYRRLNSAYARTEDLIAQSHEVTPEVDAALKECVHLQEESCRAALQHVYAVAAQLPPAEGDRYIRVLRPHILEPSVPQHHLASTHPLR